MRFLLGSQVIELSGDRPLMAALRLEAPVAPLPGDDTAHVRLVWAGNHATIFSPNGTRHVEVADPQMRLSLTWTLLGQELGSFQDQICLHGTAIRNSHTGQMRLILGPSGSGKTTLTLLMLAREGAWQLLSEDLIVVNAADRLVHPFPRAATVRTAPDSMLMRQAQAIGKLVEVRDEDSVGGRLLLQYSNAATEPAPVSGAEIFLLTAPEEATTGTDTDVLLLTSCEEALAADLSASGFPVSRMQHMPGGVAVSFEAAIERSRWQQVMDIIAKHDSMFLRRSSSTSQWRFRHAPEPALRRISPMDGALALLRHQVTSPHALRRIRPSQSLLALGRLFESCLFCEVIPGGTPESTLEKVLGWSGCCVGSR